MIETLFILPLDSDNMALASSALSLHDIKVKAVKKRIASCFIKNIIR